MIQFIAACRFFGHALILVLLLFSSCHSNDKQLSAFEKLQDYEKRTLILPSGEKIQTFIAQGVKQQVQGLSGVQEKDFTNEMAMLFPGDEDMERKFWMPDTYFNLDIFFLDKDMKVVEIERDVPFHPGRSEPPPIARTKTVYCRHVLEMKSTSALAKKIRLSQILRWQK